MLTVCIITCRGCYTYSVCLQVVVRAGQLVGEVQVPLADRVLHVQRRGLFLLLRHREPGPGVHRGAGGAHSGGRVRMRAGVHALGLPARNRTGGGGDPPHGE